MQPGLTPARLRNTALLLAYCGLIFWLSSRSVLPIPMLFTHEDKLVHASAYALMAWLAWQVFGQRRPASWPLVGICVLFCSLYGASDEWHQSFVPGRDADVFDWLADTIGAGLSVMVLFWIQRRSSIGM